MNKYEVTGHYRHGFRTVCVEAEDAKKALIVGRKRLASLFPGVVFLRFKIHEGW